MRLDPRRFEVMEDDMVEILRAKSPMEKLAMAESMWRMARDLICDKLRLDHPDWSEKQLARETARRLSHGAV